MITYVHGGVIRNKIQLSLNSFTRWVSRLHIKSQHQQFQLPDNTRNNIPEVTFNYCEHREPLIGQEYNSRHVRLCVLAIAYKYCLFTS